MFLANLKNFFDVTSKILLLIDGRYGGRVGVCVCVQGLYIHLRSFRIPDILVSSVITNNIS